MSCLLQRMWNQILNKMTHLEGRTQHFKKDTYREHFCRKDDRIINNLTPLRVWQIKATLASKKYPPAVKDSLFSMLCLSYSM